MEFAVIIFFEEGDPAKYSHNIKSFPAINKLLDWVSVNLQGGDKWQRANVYDKKTGKFVIQIKNLKYKW